MAAAPDREAVGTFPRARGAPRVLLGLAALILILAVLELPVTNFWTFLLLILAVILVGFGNIDRRPSRWVMAMGATTIVVTAGQVLPSPAIQEGHNVFVPIQGTLPVFEKGLPPAAFRTMKAEFDRSYFEQPDGLPGSPDWWNSSFLALPAYFTRQAFAPSADALWRKPKYSRIVDGIGFSNQDQARIGAVNTRVYNFYGKARIHRRRLPFFVMAELNPALEGGEICWRGHILWEGQNQSFDSVISDQRRCRQITGEDAGRRVFALSIARDRPLDFHLSPPPGLRLSLWIQQLARLIGLALILGLLIRIDALHELLLPLGAAVATLLTIAILKPNFLTTFGTHDAGNDGLTHESMGRDIAGAVVEGRWLDALRGSETVFYYMPGLRYFRAIEDFLFGDTNFGIVLVMIFLPVFLYAFMCSLLPLRWRAALIVAFLFTPIFERFGFAEFNHIRLLVKGFAEPVGYTAFLGGLALIGHHLGAGQREGPAPAGMPVVWTGLAFALSVAMRPNLAIAAALVIFLLCLWLMNRRRVLEMAGLALGFGLVSLIPLHNWYFGGEFVPLTSTAWHPANLQTPPSVYLAALGELVGLDFAGANLDRALRHLKSWNAWSDFYRIIAVLLVVWIALRPGTPAALRALAAVALSMQGVLLFYHAKGRYTYLAWLLVFLIVMVAIREVLLPWSRRHKPHLLEAAARLPGVRHLGAVIGSPRWSLAYDLSRISPLMGLLEGFKTECRPLVSPLKEVLDRLPPACRLYDIGCGAGGLLHLALLRAGATRAAGYDVSSRAVAAAMRLPWRAGTLSVSRRDPADGVPDLSGFDIVTMVDVLHHVRPPDQVGLIGQVAGKMRPGARLVLVDIDAGRPVGRWLNQLHDVVVSGEWVAPRRAEETERMVSDVGLRIRESSRHLSLWYPHYLLVAEKPMA